RILTTAASADPKYNKLKPPDVSLVNHDNDTLDLQISNLTLTPASGLQSGATLLVQWTVTNVGNLATARSFSDLVVIKNTTTGQTLSSTPLLYDQSTSGNGPIAPGASRQRQVSFHLPDGAPGAGQIQVTTTVNYVRDVTESDPTGANNS